MALFTDDAYNKSVLKSHGTLIGNWNEEETLRNATGDARSKRSTAAAVLASEASFNHTKVLNDPTAHRASVHDYTFDRLHSRKFDHPSTTYSDLGQAVSKQFFRQARYQNNEGPREAIVNMAIWESAKEEVKRESDEFLNSLKPDFKLLNSTYKDSFNTDVLIPDPFDRPNPAGMISRKCTLNPACMTATSSMASGAMFPTTLRAEMFEPIPAFPKSRGANGRRKLTYSVDSLGKNEFEIVRLQVERLIAPANEVIGPYITTSALTSTVSLLTGNRGSVEGITGDANLNGFKKSTEFSTPVNLQMNNSCKDWAETERFLNQNQRTSNGTSNLNKSLTSVIHTSNNLSTSLSTPLVVLRSGIATILRAAFGNNFAFAELRRFLRGAAGRDGTVSIHEVIKFLKDTARSTSLADQTESLIPSVVIESTLKLECRMHKDRAHWHSVLRLLRDELFESRRAILIDFISQLIVEHGSLTPNTQINADPNALRLGDEVPKDPTPPSVRDLFVPLGVVKSILGKGSPVWEVIETASALDIKSAEWRTNSTISDATGGLRSVSDEVMVTPALVIEAFKDISASLGPDYEGDMSFARLVPSIY